MTPMRISSTLIDRVVISTGAVWRVAPNCAVEKPASASFPCERENAGFSTAHPGAPGCSGRNDKFLFNKYLQPQRQPSSRVEPVAQCVRDKVERQNAQRDGDSREDDQMWRVE